MKDIRCDLCGGGTVPHVTSFSSCRRCVSCGELVHVGPSPRPPITIREASLPAEVMDVALDDLQRVRRDLEEERLHELGG
ncbi:MAG TPA: hypothetical protein VGK23_02305 [Methanomassiliicoccales archaeon]